MRKQRHLSVENLDRREMFAANVLGTEAEFSTQITADDVVTFDELVALHEMRQLADGTQVGSEGYVAPSQLAEGTQNGALPRVHAGNADDIFTEFKAKPPQIPNQ